MVIVSRHSTEAPARSDETGDAVGVNRIGGTARTSQRGVAERKGGLKGGSLRSLFCRNRKSPYAVTVAPWATCDGTGTSAALNLNRLERRKQAPTYCAADDKRTTHDH